MVGRQLTSRKKNYEEIRVAYYYLMKKEIRDLVAIRADPVGYCPTHTELIILLDRKN